MEAEGVLHYKEPAKLITGDNVVPNTTPQPSDGKNKRRYWSNKEEEVFFMLWGRDNWRLSRHGKNTIVFAEWSQEMKKSYGITIKPEEVQAKVNQTRAKFRQVCKQPDNQSNPRRWKKFELIDGILRNQYRPKDAEPIPQKAVEKNRGDISVNDSEYTEKPLTPINYNSNSQSAQNNSHNEQRIENSGTPLPSLPFKNEIYDNEYDIKNEEIYDYQYQTPHSYTQIQDTVELHQMQPAQQIFQTPSEYQRGVENQLHPVPTQDNPITVTNQQQLIEQHMHQQLQNEQGHQVEQIHHTNYSQNPQIGAYTNSVIHSTGLAHPNALGNSTMNSSNVATSNQISNAYGNIANDSFANGNANNAHSTASVNGNNKIDLKVVTPSQNASAARKRRLSTVNSTTIGDNLEIVFLEELRKKNSILEERKDISRRLLEIEERKMSLLENFVPKFLAIQDKIWQKLNDS